MLPSSFKQASSRQALFDGAAKREPRPFPPGVALLCIVALSLALWAGIGLLLRAFILG